jgi:mono/diheme cytochrome c family protein
MSPLEVVSFALGIARSTSGVVACVALGTVSFACSGVDGEGRASNGVEESRANQAGGTGVSGREREGALTVEARLEACAQDPRVLAGLVSPDVCAGADIFFRETFDGNGRTCGSCHPMANNTTLDVPFITALRESNPKDPLFVAETNPALRELETSDLLNFASILENVDGFQDPKQRFVSRSVSHVLSLATSLAPDPADVTANAPLERTGWSGDGAPADGSLRAFLEGAIKQHFTKSLERRANVDFRLPTAQEADLTRTFQLSLGRLNELNLEQVRIEDAEGEEGRRVFLDPLRGRCNVCHANAGANFLDTGKNRNFDSGIREGSSVVFVTRGTVAGIGLEDGGFGGAELEQPNLETFGIVNALGDGTFSPPPLIEAADTAPFFHNAFRSSDKDGTGGDINGAVSFYATPGFRASPGAKLLDERFGAPLDLQAFDSASISRFLRILNAAFNIDLASQRLQAVSTLALRFNDTRSDIQQGLLRLAVVEIDDALEVLDGHIYPDAQVQLRKAKDEIAEGLAAATWSERNNRTSNAIADCQGARALFGSKLDFVLGQGNLMF